MADTARLSLLDVVQEGQGHDRDKVLVATAQKGCCSRNLCK